MRVMVSFDSLERSKAVVESISIEAIGAHAQGSFGFARQLSDKGQNEGEKEWTVH